MKIKTYSSGLRLVVNTKKDNDIVSFRIFVGCGSKDESPSQFGTAHFLEHMFFKSTKDLHYTQIMQMFDSLGIKYNAFTGFNKTCYYFKCLSAQLDKTMQIFSNMYFNTTFNKEEISKEQKVILEELNMDLDDPEKICLNNAIAEFFKGLPYEHKIIGTKNTIKAVTKDSLAKFKQKNYVPSNIVISVSGNITFGKIETLLKKYFSKLFQGNFSGEFNKHKYLPLNITKNYISKFKDNEQTTVNILLDLGDKTNKEMYAYDLYFAILGYGMSSKFFTKIRGELGLVYSIMAGASVMGKNSIGDISFASSGETVCNVLYEIVNILKQCADGDISQEELDRAKNKTIANLEYAIESNSSISNSNGAELLLENKIDSQKTIVQDIKNVTLNQVLDCAKDVLSCKNFVVSSVGRNTQKDLKCFNLAK